MWVNMGMSHSLCLDLGADEHPCTTYFDVHQGYRVLTHSHMFSTWSHHGVFGMVGFAVLRPAGDTFLGSNSSGRGVGRVEPTSHRRSGRPGPSRDGFGIQFLG